MASSRVRARRSIRALEMPPACHRKIGSEAGVDETCSACKELAANRSKSHLRTQRFTKPSSGFGGFDERELPYGQNSLPALSPIGHGSNYEGHAPPRQEARGTVMAGNRRDCRGR